MNRIYRLVWNYTLNTWVAVAENAKGRGKSTVSGRKLIALALAAAIGPMAANAAPLGGEITSGTGTIAQAGAVTNITQATPKLAINWQDFGIATGETVNFLQPSAAAIALNRVVGQNPSQILGNLNANGQVFVLNPNGVLFGAGAQVNVGGLVASTLDLTDADFNADKFTFSNGGVAGTGMVDNQGTLNAASGGYIALISTNVTNTGTINAQQGMAALASGNTVTLNLNNGSLLGYTIDAGTANALISNGGLISANGGQVLITAQGADALSTAVVNNTGVIEAQTVQNVGGVIKLMADMTVGQINVDGKLDASAPASGDGGFVETSAATVNVADAASVTTSSTLGVAGNWLIDPADYIIGAGGNMSGAALSTSLAGGSVTIQTGGTAAGNGDIFVNDVVTWGANRLTLSSYRNININTSLNGSGTANLALQYGQGVVAAGNLSDYFVRAAVNLPAGPNFSTKLGSDGVVKNFTVITNLGAAGSTTATDLQGMNGSLAGNYALGASIDATPTSAWNAGAGFKPLGNLTSKYTGSFDGLGHTVNGLFINRPSAEDVGLFGVISQNSVVQNIGLVGGSATGWVSVGQLAGRNYGVINSSFATGSVTSTGWIAGGLVGLQGMSNQPFQARIYQSYATGNVSVVPISGTGHFAGGLVGQMTNSTISSSYASGNVTSAIGNSVGGLVGYVYGDIGVMYPPKSMITDSYATGSVMGKGSVGGLIGIAGGNTLTFNAYATGSVTGAAGGIGVGGLVGQNGSYSCGSQACLSTIANSYSSGLVTANGASYARGLVGDNMQATGVVVNSYWDTTTSGQVLSAGGTGRTTAQMMTQYYPGFDFVNTWWLSEGNTRPFLRSEYSSNIVNAHQLQLMALNLEASYTLGTNIDMAELTRGSGMWNNSKGFAPVGNATTPFAGTFDGFGHTISNLAINRPATDYVGLFGYAGSGASIQNVGLVGGSVNGQNYVGGLVGENHGTLTNNYTTGNVTGVRFKIGGLVGYNIGTLISNYATGNVSGTFVDTNSGGGSIGGLVGYNGLEGNGYENSLNDYGTLISNYATGNVSGANGYSHIGGLVGTNNYGDLINNYATGNVNGTYELGGLVGTNFNGNLTNNYATGNVSGQAGLTDRIGVGNQIGGLVGRNHGAHGWGNGQILDNVGGLLINNYATGDVIGGQEVGGLVGNNWGGALTNNYATGNVSLGTYLYNREAGGLVGRNRSSVLTNNYATGSVSGAEDVGGLIGYNYGGTLTNNYAMGRVSGRNSAGGLVGQNDISYIPGYYAIHYSCELGDTCGMYYGFIATGPGTGAVATNSYWDVQSTGQIRSTGENFSVGGTGLTTVQMQQQSNFAGFDFANTWRIYEGQTTPLLKSFLTPLTVTANSQAKTYGGIAYVGGNGVNFSITPNGNLLGSITYSGTSQGAVNTGSYLITPGGLYSNQQGYDISYVDGTLTINSAVLDLSVAAHPQTKVYGTSDPLFTFNSSGFANGDTVASVLTGALSRIAGENVGAYAITQGTLAANSNYTINYTGADLMITPATLNIVANALTKVYGSADPALSYTASGFQFADSAASVLTGELARAEGKNVGSYAITQNNLASNSNYTVQYTGANLDITPYAMTVSALGQSKVYDSTTNATVTLSHDGLAGDDLSTAYTADFADKNVGIGKMVNVSSITLSGADAGNYTLNTAATTSADITKASLTIAAVAQNKTYDTTTNATVALSNNGFAGDDLNTGFATASFTDKNAGIGKLVTVDGITLGGADAGNYTFNTAATTTADIAKAYLSIAAATENKVYDATTGASVALINDAFTGDDLSTSFATANFADKNVGTGKLVTIDGITLGGADAGNYSFSPVITATADITARALLISATGVDKTFDHTTDATVIFSDDRIAGDEFTAYGTATFDAAHVGFDMAIYVTDIGLTGVDALNYTFNTTAETTANIAPPVKNVAKKPDTWVWR